MVRWLTDWCVLQVQCTPVIVPLVGVSVTYQFVHSQSLQRSHHWLQRSQQQYWWWWWWSSLCGAGDHGHCGPRHYGAEEGLIARGTVGWQWRWDSPRRFVLQYEAIGWHVMMNDGWGQDGKMIMSVMMSGHQTILHSRQLTSNVPHVELSTREKRTCRPLPPQTACRQLPMNPNRGKKVNNACGYRHPSLWPKKRSKKKKRLGNGWIGCNITLCWRRPAPWHAWWRADLIEGHLPGNAGSDACSRLPTISAGCSHCCPSEFLMLIWGGIKLNWGVNWICKEGAYIWLVDVMHRALRLAPGEWLPCAHISIVWATTTKNKLDMLNHLFVVKDDCCEVLVLFACSMICSGGTTAMKVLMGFCLCFSSSCEESCSCSCFVSFSESGSLLCWPSSSSLYLNRLLWSSKSISILSEKEDKVLWYRCWRSCFNNKTDAGLPTATRRVAHSCMVLKKRKKVPLVATKSHRKQTQVFETYVIS